MNPQEINPYLKTKVMTASPEELRLMLYEGAIKFCHRAKAEHEAGNREGVFDSLMKAQKIVLELSTSLNHTAAPDLCSKLSALYTYIYRLLVDANVEHDGAPIDEAMKLLVYERETWKMLMTRLNSGDESVNKEDASHLVGAQQTAISSLSING